MQSTWMENRAAGATARFSRKRHAIGFCAALLAAKCAAVFSVASACEMAGGDRAAAAELASWCLAPSTVLEFATVAFGYGAVKKLRNGPLLGTDIEKGVRCVSWLIYGCFFANAGGMAAIGYFLGLGLAIAAPLMAPFAPMLVGSGLLFALTSSIRRGTALEAEVADTI